MFKQIFSAISVLIGKIHWKQRKPLSAVEKQQIMDLLKTDYYIICTRRSNHLSTYAISLGHFLMTGKFGRYGHVLLNFEDTVSSVDDFRLIEAVGVGTKFSTFEEVFGDIDGVCLMKPIAMTIDEWTGLLDTAKNQVGKPYDTLFDLKTDSALSCVELVRNILKTSPNYETDFAAFEQMVKRSMNLTPQMFRDCSDFEPVLEINHK